MTLRRALHCFLAGILIAGIIAAVIANDAILDGSGDGSAVAASPPAPSEVWLVECYSGGLPMLRQFVSREPDIGLDNAVVRWKDNDGRRWLVRGDCIVRRVD